MTIDNFNHRVTFFKWEPIRDLSSWLNGDRILPLGENGRRLACISAYGCNNDKVRVRLMRLLRMTRSRLQVPHCQVYNVASDIWTGLPVQEGQRMDRDRPGVAALDKDKIVVAGEQEEYSTKYIDTYESRFIFLSQAVV